MDRYTQIAHKNKDQSLVIKNLSVKLLLSEHRRHLSSTDDVEFINPLAKVCVIELLNERSYRWPLLWSSSIMSCARAPGAL